MFYAILAVFSYLIGAAPISYLFVKYFSGKDLLKEGTGNVGTMNTHRATNSKLLSFMVLAIDVTKGVVAYHLGQYFLGSFELDSTAVLALSAVSVILGHNYSLFLRFKGGKGLAAAAGYMFLVSPLLIVAWAIICGVVILFTQYFVLGQIIATLLLPIITLFIDDQHIFPVLLLCIVIFLKHAPRIQNLLKETEPKMYYKAQH